MLYRIHLQRRAGSADAVWILLPAVAFAFVWPRLRSDGLPDPSPALPPGDADYKRRAQEFMALRRVQVAGPPPPSTATGASSG